MQYGFCKGRNTYHTLADLQTQISNATNSNSCLYSIFFDLQEAFPRVWRHYICNKLHKIGLRGNLPKILQDFLHNRTLMVRIQDKISSPHKIQNGVLQGEMFSVPLFLIVINDITNCVQFPFSQRLFADDYNITLQSSDPSRAHRLLQNTLDNITNWASSRGFRFSSHKTSLLLFKKRSPTPILSPLFSQNFQIKTTKLTKFLGLLFHTTSNWTHHIKKLNLS